MTIAKRTSQLAMIQVLDTGRGYPRAVEAATLLNKLDRHMEIILRFARDCQRRVPSPQQLQHDSHHSLVATSQILRDLRSVVGDYDELGPPHTAIELGLRVTRLIICGLSQPSRLLVQKHKLITRMDKAFQVCIRNFHKETTLIHRVWMASRPRSGVFLSGERATAYSRILEVSWAEWNQLRSSSDVVTMLKIQQNCGKTSELRIMCGAMLHALHTTSFDEKDKVIRSISDSILLGTLTTTAK